jgi:hypothetical protein
LDEFSERRTVGAEQAGQGMTPMGDVAQHFLTLSTGLIRQQLADLAE